MPAPAARRFVDPRTRLTELMEEVSVVCPRCGGDARVTCAQPMWRHEPRLVCGACALLRVGWPSDWRGPARGLARRRCGRCGQWCERRFASAAVRRGKVMLRCTCGAETEAPVETRVIRYGGPYDPYFGLPVALQASVRGQLLWAWNRRHLELLAAWVGATLRERRGPPRKTLLASLPSWLGRAELRGDLMRALDRLMRRAQ
ncbi:MAG: hypothetical protein U1F43_23265 [Myxococcota bacterium]